MDMGSETKLLDSYPPPSILDLSYDGGKWNCASDPSVKWELFRTYSKKLLGGLNLNMWSA